MVAWPSMKRLPAALLFVLATAALAAPTAAPDKPFSAQLAPGESHEECMTLAKDESRTYHWKSSGPVDFNVHYHDGPEAIYPVKRQAMRGDGGSFKAKVAQDYCWMWTARDKPAKVEGAIK